MTAPSSDTLRQCGSPTLMMCPLGSICLPCWWTFCLGTIWAWMHLRPVLLSVRRWVGQGTAGWGEKDEVRRTDEMRVEERTARRKLAGDRWGREGAVRREILERDVNTEASASTRHRGTLGNQDLTSCEQWCCDKIIRGERKEEAGLLFQFCTYRLFEAGSSWIKGERERKQKGGVNEQNKSRLSDIVFVGENSSNKDESRWDEWLNVGRLIPTIRKWVEDSDLVWDEVNKAKWCQKA